MDISKIEELIDVLQGSSAEELSVKKGDNTVYIRKGKTGKHIKSSKQVTKAPIKSEAEIICSDKIIKAPMVGIFHLESNKLRSGEIVSVGQQVGAIESMKLLNDVLSEVSGEISEVYVEDGTPVEYGQPLFKITPA